MKSQIISKDNPLTLFLDKKSVKGFTIIEMMIVVGLVSVLGTLGLYFGFDSLRGYSFHSDRDVLVSVLQHARAEAVANVCRGNSSVCSDGKPHGVKIFDDKYVIFQGSDYSSRDEDFDLEIDAAPSSTHGGSIDEVVFARLSGDVAATGDITLTDDTGRVSTISINSEGQIIWTN